jgi:hypothetical protein
VALARRHGGEMIDATVTEFLSPVPLPAGADMVEVVLRQLELVFLEESGLAESRPGVRVAASRPAVYLELLENMQVHGYHLMQAADRVLTKAEISGDWYDAIFAPVMALDRGRLGGDYREAPDAPAAPRELPVVRMSTADGDRRHDCRRSEREAATGREALTQLSAASGTAGLHPTRRGHTCRAHEAGAPDGGHQRDQRADCDVDAERSRADPAPRPSPPVSRRDV